jgi:hypothetical protein
MYPKNAFGKLIAGYSFLSSLWHLSIKEKHIILAQLRTAQQLNARNSTE